MLVRRRDLCIKVVKFLSLFSGWLYKKVIGGMLKSIQCYPCNGAVVIFTCFLKLSVDLFTDPELYLKVGVHTSYVIQLFS